jgi:HK97 family phage major capsid protein
MKTLEQLTAAISALETRTNEALATIEGNESATPEQVEEVKALITGLQSEIEPLQTQRREALQAKALEDMTGELTTLQGVIADMRKAPDFAFTPSVAADGTEEGKALGDEEYGEGGQHSVYEDIRLANKNDAGARERLLKGVTFEGKALADFRQGSEGKAMTEGTQAQGGYLVRPLVERQIVLARELDNVLRGLCSKLNVTTNSIQLDQLGLTTTAGWVAELAAKPESTGMTLASVTASVFTAAGLATISNQLLADSNPAVDALVTADLAKRLVALEETAFINGTGSGQPLGILNTPGIGATALTATDIPSLLGAILDAVAAVETNHGAPSAILMHPRTWTRILKAQDAQGAYFIDPSGGPQDPRTGQRGPRKTLWGYEVITSNRLPTNLGGATNESRIIVGDFREALILDRQGITVDESEHVYFTTNQTVFRAEQRVGFTAARTPLAFNVVGGVGLANG